MKELRKQLEPLMAHRAEPCVSIYMPVEAVGTATTQNPIRLKNLLYEASRRIDDEETSQALLRSLYAAVEDESFWQPGCRGLVIFRSSTASGTYWLRNPVAPLVAVRPCFHLKPVLSLLAEPQLFYVLALSQGETRLVEVECGEARRVDTEGRFPGSVEPFMPEADAPGLQQHGAGHGRLVRHGHPDDESRQEVALRRYFQAIDNGVRCIVDDRPVVIAASAHTASAFRRYAKNETLYTSQEVEGNPTGASNQELADRAVPLVRHRLDRRRRDALEHARELQHTHLASNRLDTVRRATEDGRVASLFVSDWDPSRDDGMDRRADEQLDELAVRAYRRGAEVYVVDPDELPGDSSVAAVFRF